MGLCWTPADARARPSRARRSLRRDDRRACGGARGLARALVHVYNQQHASDPVGLYVNDKLIAYGEVVVVEDNFGIKITELVGTTKS